MVRESRVVPVTAEVAFDGTVPVELPTLFRRWYGPIPPIKAVRGQTGEWDEVGKTRTVVLRAAGSMREELTSLDRPDSFGYTLTEITGALAPVIDRVEGLWSFEAASAGTQITWQWTVHPRSAAAAMLMPVFGRLWKGYARQSLDELSTLLAD